MNKFILTNLMIVVLFSSLVIAGQVFTLDFSEKPSQVIKVAERDGLRFSLKGSEHLIKIEKVDDIENSVNIAVFIKLESAMYITLDKGNLLNIDVDRDGNSDMYVRVHDVIDKDAYLIFENLAASPAEKSTPTAATVKEIKTPTSVGTIIIPLLIILVLIFLVLIFTKKK